LCQKPRKELRLNYSTWKYSKTPRVLRLTLLTKARLGAFNLVFQNYIAIIYG
jgi:hypothetical protein